MAVQERGKHAKETEVPHGGAEGSGGVGGGQGGQDGPRAGSAAWRASDVAPCLEETARRQRGGVVPGRRQKFQRTAHEALPAQLYEQIGRLQTELAWLKKKLPASVERKRAWVDPADGVLSVSQQCELLDPGRSSYDYEPATQSAENLAWRALINREYTAQPFRASRGMR